MRLWKDKQKKMSKQKPPDPNNQRDGHVKFNLESDCIIIPYSFKKPYAPGAVYPLPWQ